MGTKENIILEQCVEFALHIFEYAELQQEKHKHVIAKQQLKSGMSIGINTDEVQNTGSCTDLYIHTLNKIRKSTHQTINKMDIKVLGTGCAKCKALESATRQAADELNLNAAIEKVEDIMKIMEYGIMRTPGLVINGKVVLTGQVPKIKELKEILTKNQ